MTESFSPVGVELRAGRVCEPHHPPPITAHRPVVADQLQHLAKPPIRLILLLISTIFFFVRHRVQRGVYLLVNISCRCTRIHGTTIISQLILSYAFLSSCFASWALRTKHTTVIQVQVIISKKNWEEISRGKRDGEYRNFYHTQIVYYDRAPTNSVLSF